MLHLSDTLGTPDTTLAVALSLEDMVDQSDVIAIGNCVETRSVWVDRTLVTLATVSVSETLKGTEIRKPYRRAAGRRRRESSSFQLQCPIRAHHD